MNERKIKVEDFEIGSGRTFVIAEIGSNHCRDLDTAYRSIDAAALAGADAVKFQSINLEELYLEPDEQTRTLHDRIDLPEEWHTKLQEFCRKRGVIFFSSPTYLKAIDLLEEINVPLYKLASAQVGTFPQLIEKVARTGKPVILSTGLVSYSGLEAAIRIFERNGNRNYIILHCNSLYPAPSHRIHLNLMGTYRAMFGAIVGFSDHSGDATASIASVALGACVIEKHFTLSRDLDSPDAPLSMEPPEFKSMVSAIREVEEMLKPGIRIGIEPEEMAFQDRIATRLVISQDLPAGHMLQATNFEYLRHPEGIDCREVEKIEGKRLKHDMLAGTPLRAEDLQ